MSMCSLPFSIIAFLQSYRENQTMEIQQSSLLHSSYDSPSKVYTVLHALIHKQHNAIVIWPIWPSIFQTMEDLRHCLLYTTLELENTKLAVEQEINKREHQLIHIRKLVEKVARERDEAHDQCQRLLLQNIVLQQHEHEHTRENESNHRILTSDCEESIVLPPQFLKLDEMLPHKPLPEKGKLLQAVMKAGPLLQTLLLAGPLPQWRHPPPTIESSEIPPVKIALFPPPVFLQDGLLSCGRVCRKRGVPEDFGSTVTKYQRALLPWIKPLLQNDNKLNNWWYITCTEGWSLYG